MRVRRLPPGRPVVAFLALLAMLATAGAQTRSAVAGFALWSDQGVFRSEATQAAGLLSRRYGAAPSLVRSNSRARLAAGAAAIAATIAQAGRGLDPERDVLFVVLTSHGSPEGIAVQGGGVEGVLPPAVVGGLLARSPVRRKALIVSACYSGIFTSLADPDTLVITAADAAHPSFGCTAEARWTYFGEAFFDTALRSAVGTGEPLETVFARAAALVRARETREGFEPSNPQIAGGANVLAALREAAGR